MTAPPALTLDLVICTFDNAALLERTLASIARQHVSLDVEWQVLVVDNNCTDRTPEVVDAFVRAAAFPLRMVRELRPGLTAARVCGARSTRGDWIAFVDDDCLLAEDWVEQASRFALAHSDCGAFGGQVTPSWETPPPAFVRRRRYAYAGKSHGDTAHRRPWLAGAGLVVQRAALDACGWTDHQLLEDRTGAALVSGGDMELTLRLAARFALWYTPDCRIEHIIPARRMTRDYLRRMTFGLGASRHNAGALTWSGSYGSWLAWSAFASLALGARELLAALRDAIGERSAVDVSLATSTVRGWWSAMRAMFRMKPDERRRLLGGARTEETK
jgi:glycosyltransferase involved in cell wall biosynthesis